MPHRLKSELFEGYDAVPTAAGVSRATTRTVVHTALGVLGLDFVSAIGGAASSLGNVGPAFGSLSPLNNFNGLPAIGKWWCAFLMLAGRLELFTVLILLTPYFWKRT